MDNRAPAAPRPRDRTVDPGPATSAGNRTCRTTPRGQRFRLEITVDLNDLTERLMIAATELAGQRPPARPTTTVVALLPANGHLIIDVIDHDPTSRPTIDPDRPACWRP